MIDKETKEIFLKISKALWWIETWLFLIFLLK